MVAIKEFSAGSSLVLAELMRVSEKINSTFQDVAD